MRKTDEARMHNDTPIFEVTGMKSGGKPVRNDARKKLSRCPFFRQYYLGVCSAHVFPYAPSLDEKKQYCLAPGFPDCLIYEQYLSTDGLQGR
jgi:hypothetical protein